MLLNECPDRRAHNIISGGLHWHPLAPSRGLYPICGQWDDGHIIQLDSYAAMIYGSVILHSKLFFLGLRGIMYNTWIVKLEKVHDTSHLDCRLHILYFARRALWQSSSSIEVIAIVHHFEYKSGKKTPKESQPSALSPNISINSSVINMQHKYK